MRLESEYIHYRARFVVEPEPGTPDSPLPFVMERLQQWIALKEEEHQAQEGIEGYSLIARVLHSNTVDLQDCIDIGMVGGDLGVTSRSCLVSEAFVSGLSLPKEYEGGLSIRTNARSLCTRPFVGRGDWHIPQAWALEYDEPDSELPWRHWHTSVGITRLNDGQGAIERTAPCLVNIRISNYLKPGYLGEPPEQPLATTPRFVRDLLTLPGFRSRVGSTEVRDGATMLTAETFTSDFLASLTDPERGMPLVLSVSDLEGKHPAGSLAILSACLMGGANVYALDASDEASWQALQEGFAEDTPTRAFGCDAGVMRIYLPRPDLWNRHDSVRHRFLTKDAQLELGGRVASVVVRAIVDAWSATLTDVLDTDDVAEAARAEDLNEQLREMNQRVEQAGRRVADLLDASSADEAEKQRLRDEIDLYAQSFDEEIDRLKDQLRASDADLRAERRAHAELQRNPLRSFSEGAQPSLDDCLTMAELLFGDRIAVMESAHESAQEWPYGDSEGIALIRSIATTLWELKFGGWHGDIEEEFRARTGFELAMTEGKTTKNDRKIMRSRTVSFEGRDVEIVTHVKGKGRYNQSLRVYVGFDDDGAGHRRVVIASCGRHLTTAGTRRM